jgi:hypothetical protein
LKDEDQHAILESWTLATTPAEIYFHSEIHTNVWHTKVGERIRPSASQNRKSMSFLHDFALFGRNSCIDTFRIKTRGQHIHMKPDNDGSVQFPVMEMLVTLHLF